MIRGTVVRAPYHDSRTPLARGVSGRVSPGRPRSAGRPASHHGHISSRVVVRAPPPLPQSEE
eukprot:5264471-Prymnesium_polylepis.1